jgi:transcriptional regulator with XRE-family HTH domain
VSPKPHRAAIDQAAARAIARMAGSIGQALREERLRRRRTLRQLAAAAGVSASLIQRLEGGDRVSLETYVRVATALELRPELAALDARKRSSRASTAEDPVHAAMGEVEARRLRGHGSAVSIDEPYQHYQFAGRADVIAWELEKRALLHIENRTRFPNIQDALGSYNAKRAYLPAVLAGRLGIERTGWDTVTHAMVVLWSAEALHSIRLHVDTFRSICPDPPTDFEGWWMGKAPASGRVSSSLIVFDPSRSSAGVRGAREDWRSSRSVPRLCRGRGCPWRARLTRRRKLTCPNRHIAKASGWSMMALLEGALNI